MTSLLQKLIEIRKVCAYLKKENAGYQFKFVSSSQTIGALRSKMDELGVLLVPKILTHAVKDHETKKGDHEFFTELEIEYTWINAEDANDRLTVTWYGQGIDSGEKGVGKALTYAEKYFLLKFFQIATDKDDPDSYQQKNGSDHVSDSSPKTSGKKSEKPRAETKPKEDPKKEEPKDVLKEKRLKIMSILKEHDVKNGGVKDVLERILKRKIEHSTDLNESDLDEILGVVTDPDKLADALLPF